jgi:hypothetical protein
MGLFMRPGDQTDKTISGRVVVKAKCKVVKVG